MPAEKDVQLRTDTGILRNAFQPAENAQSKRWEENIKEWTGLEWNNLLRKAENR